MSKYPFSLKDELLLVETVDYCYPTTGWKDRMMSFGGEACCYDEMGNPKLYRNKETEFSTFGNLLSVKDFTTDIAKYSYMNDGLRFSKTVGNNKTNYYWVDGNLHREVRGTDELWYYYGCGGITGFSFNGVKYYYRKDIQQGKRMKRN